MDTMPSELAEMLAEESDEHVNEQDRPGTDVTVHTQVEADAINAQHKSRCAGRLVQVQQVETTGPDGYSKNFECTHHCGFDLGSWEPKPGTEGDDAEPIYTFSVPWEGQE